MHDRLENFLAAFAGSTWRARAHYPPEFGHLPGHGGRVGLHLALLGRIPLTIGVVGHEGSTVVVVMNSLRLLLESGDKKAT